VQHLALSVALLRKGRSAEEIANTSRIIYLSLGQDDRSTFKRLQALRIQFATLSLAGPDALTPADYQQRLKSLADQSDALELELARHSEPFRRFYVLPSPDELISHIAASLRSDSALVELVTYEDLPLVPKTHFLPSRIPGELRYLALLLFADGRARTVDLGPVERIDRAARTLHDALANSSIDYQPAAQALYALAFRPLLPLLGKVRRLFLAPDGELSLIPFAALHDGRRFLVDAFDITYLLSGKELLPSSVPPPSPDSVVVLAAPDFGSSSPASSPERQSTPARAGRSTSLKHFFAALRSEGPDAPWPPLPGTRQEAEAIHRLFPHAQLLLGPDATKQALLNLPTPGLLHIATHGFFLEDAPTAPSSRAVNNFGAVGAGPVERPADPLLRSGLVLAGIHPPAAPPGSHRPKDSLVTALELAGLNLWGTQLVVLSACNTGRGDVKLGEGVYGLRRAFLVAGAQTLVTSLWKVNDETTSQLMDGYYRHLLAGQGRTTALHEAMKQLRRKEPHPHFWAPFTALGLDAPLQGLAPPAHSPTSP
jgi:CHAT domain-containing protein